MMKLILIAMGAPLVVGGFIVAIASLKRSGIAWIMPLGWGLLGWAMGWAMSWLCAGIITLCVAQSA